MLPPIGDDNAYILQANKKYARLRLGMRSVRSGGGLALGLRPLSRRRSDIRVNGEVERNFGGGRCALGAFERRWSGFRCGPPAALNVVLTSLVLSPPACVVCRLLFVITSPRIDPCRFALVVDLPAILCDRCVGVQLRTADAWLADVLSDPSGRERFGHAEECFPGKARRHGRIDLNQLGELSAASRAGLPPDDVDDTQIMRKWRVNEVVRRERRATRALCKYPRLILGAPGCVH